jgi:hypothetical protein
MSSPYRHQPVSWHLECRCGLFERVGFVRRLDLAHPDGFAGELVDVPADRLWRFGRLGHEASIDRKASTFNPAEGANWWF